MRKRIAHRSLKWAVGSTLNVRVKPIAVVRRSQYEATEFEVIKSPTMEILAQGFETQDAAEIAALSYNVKGRIE